ncbi:hypothetical protein GCM10010458_36540 [Microbacterium luteolum]|uniref:Uncharacterized protein n=1 Tax=Microbacterium luteolum TaxID=69367 RepID=A0ABY7XKA1_MICLT|nr:hypothetical protein [Microbacterium luteolum]WDM42519.1 hypothetical protein KV395_04200 [Microbacterium luteolum]
MTTAPPPDIDAQVTAFRDQMAGLAAIEPEQIAADVARLATAMRTADNHELAAVAMREFYDTHTVEYSRAIIIGALSALSVTILVAEDPKLLPGPTGMMVRLTRLAWAVRGLGITLNHPGFSVGGEF